MQDHERRQDQERRQDHERRRHRGSDDDDHDLERGLRGLIGQGASQVSSIAAMRARDAARPTDEDIARAEQRVQIVRRGWVPRDPL
jgi:hypothetical protein